MSWITLDQHDSKLYNIRAKNPFSSLKIFKNRKKRHKKKKKHQNVIRRVMKIARKQIHCYADNTFTTIFFTMALSSSRNAAA